MDGNFFKDSRQSTPLNYNGQQAEQFIKNEKAVATYLHGSKFTLLFDGSVAMTFQKEDEFAFVDHIPRWEGFHQGTPISLELKPEFLQNKRQCIYDV